MKNYLTLLLLFLAGYGSAQDVLLFEDAPSQTLVYRYSNLSGPAAPAVRQMLQLLEPQQPSRAAFHLNYTYQARVLEQAQQLKIEFDWLELTVSHEPRPLGFPFDAELLPGGVTFQLELLADGAVVSTQQVSQPVGQRLPHYDFTFAPVAGGVLYTLRTSNLQFTYGSREVLAVQDRVKAIDLYRRAKTDLLRIQADLAALSQTEPRPADLPALSNQLNNLQQQLRNVEQAHFWPQLALDTPQAYDPEQLRALRQTCAADLQQQQRWLDDLRRNLHELYYTQGVDRYEHGQPGAAREAFRQSLRANDCYAPSHYFLAFLDFADGQVPAAAQRLTKVLNNYDPDPQTAENARQLAQRIVRFYLDEGAVAVANRQYPAGVALYREAFTFSQSIRGFRFGQAEAESRIQEAFYLDFHDQLDEVLNLYRNQYYDQALQQLDAALAFQAQTGVRSTYDTRGLQRDLVQAALTQQVAAIKAARQEQQWDEALRQVAATESFLADYHGLATNTVAFEQARDQVVNGKYQSLYATAEASTRSKLLDQAPTEARQAREFAVSYQLPAAVLRSSDAQLSGIQQQRYQRFVQGGDRAREQAAYTQALEQYEQARQLEKQEASLVVAPLLGSKIKATAVSEVERQFETVMPHAGSDNAQLHGTYQALQELTRQYQLGAEPRIAAVFRQLDTQLCTNAHDLLLPQQERLLASQQEAGDYLAARATLVAITELLATYANCGLSDASLRMAENVVAACAAYQETLAAAQQAEARQQFGRAIEQYVAAARQYQNPSVQARLAGHPAFLLFAYLANHPNYRMTLAGADYFLSQREHDRAWALLQATIRQGVHPKATEAVQQRLGSALAVRDYLPAANWKTAFSAYVGKSDRKTYQTMYQAFRKQWRQAGRNS